MTATPSEGGCIGLACERCRPKLDDTLSAAGLVECKATGDAGQLLAAFACFSSTGRADAPFHIEATPGHRQWAWPLQFHPSTIGVCRGSLRQGTKASA